jgi:aryl-alcohol dehydrogenase-like predicted oxidoreductase
LQALFERFSRYSNPEAECATAEYVALARHHDLDPAQMALAWVLRDPRVTSALIGVSRPEQLRENVAALDQRSFTAEELATIDAIVS